MIVIDIGCARYGGDYSIERLIEEFSPDMLYGFDPNDAVVQTGIDVAKREERSTKVILDNRAAWTFDGEIGYLAEGLNSCLTDRADAPKVPCFDLAAFIGELYLTETPGPEIVLKIDAEGAEFELLDHLIARGVDRLLHLAWVEWHPFGVAEPEARRAWIEEHIGCDLTEWRW